MGENPTGAIYIVVRGFFFFFLPFSSFPASLADPVCTTAGLRRAKPEERKGPVQLRTRPGLPQHVELLRGARARAALGMLGTYLLYFVCSAGGRLSPAVCPLAETAARSGEPVAKWLALLDIYLFPSIEHARSPSASRRGRTQQPIGRARVSARLRSFASPSASG